MSLLGSSRLIGTSALEEDSSILNANVKFSELDMSIVSNDETTVRGGPEESTIPLSCKLSITLEQEERELISKQKGRNVRSDSLIANCNGNSTNGSAIQDVTNDTDNTSMENTVSQTMQDDEEESVIPVDEDEEENSTLQTTKQQPQEKSITKEMFSHLQPDKTAVVEETLSTMEVDLSIAEHSEILQDTPYVDDELPQLGPSPDESDFFKNPLIELGRRLWVSNNQKQCYTKGCLWSPDGTCLLVPVNMDGMHVIELPTDLYSTNELNSARELSPLSSAVHVKEGGMVYDCTWYPFMNSTDPASSCWLATRQHEPIHMWDAFSGELRCSYRGYDDVDEVESAISVAFSNDGQKVVGGYKKNIKIFDTNIPGREYTSIPVKQTVSCFAFTDDNDNCVTTGSWNSHIYHYDLRTSKLGPLFVLGDHTGGITWLKYSAYNTDNWYLFSGARKDNRILQWDMRNYQRPVKVYERKVETNQRIYFDQSPLQKWLISGDTDGLLRLWDVDDMQENIQIPLHADCCNGVSFHPTLPIISTSSGQYHFLDVGTESEKSVESDAKKTVTYENSVLFLWFGASKIE